MTQETHSGIIWDVKIYDKVIVASIPNNSLWFYYAYAQLRDSDADFQHFDKLMLGLRYVCPSPVSLFIEFLYWTTAPRYSAWLSIDRYGCTDVLQVSASFGLLIQRLYMAFVDVDEDNGLVRPPDSFKLYANYPNPFNPFMTIKFQVPFSVHVELDIYNVLGERVRTLMDQHCAAGLHSVTWDGVTDDGLLAPAGLYVCRMKSGEYVSSRKVVLTR